MSGCDLCGLPTPDPPVVDQDGTARYCCRGCLQVAETIGAIDVNEAEREREEDKSVPDDAAVTYCTVDGMHCSTCETFLGLRGDDIEGIYAVELNHAMNSAKVTYDPDTIEEDAILDRLSGTGYDFHVREERTSNRAVSRQQSETVQRLIVGGFLSMLIMPWYFFYLYPLYVGFETGLLDMGRTTTVGIFFPLVVIAVLTTIVFAYTGFPILRGAWISIQTRQPNMDLLVTMAAMSAYLYSVLALLDGRTHLYFDVTVMVVMVVSLGRYYEGRMRSSAAGEIAAVTRARVTEAVRLLDGGRERVPVSALRPGDEVLVSPGERVPVDGRITRGGADIDESILTGERFPVGKEPGDPVIGGSEVLDHTITVEVGTDVSSTADRIAAAMWDVQTSRPGVQRFADALAVVFVPIVLVLGVGVTIWQLWSGDPVQEALLRGLTILLVSCPCAMGLATPLAISAGLRDALSTKTIVTNDAVFETAPHIETIVFDKTGTLTRREMTVSHTVGHPDTLGNAAAVERLAQHPVADAILSEWEDQRVRADGGSNPASDMSESTVDLPDATAFERYPGAGVGARIGGAEVIVGRPELVRSECDQIPDTLATAIASIEQSGDLPVTVGWDGEARGVIALTSEARSEWNEVVEAFPDCQIVILTGDDSRDASRFGSNPGVDHVFQGVPPEGKLATVNRFIAEGPTCMIGDGTNDAPALAAADLGIAMGHGTADACDAADVVILDNDLRRIPTIFTTARGTRRRIRENIGWALTYNAIALPLAIIGLINPFFAAIAMSASSLLVVTNSKRSVNK